MYDQALGTKRCADGVTLSLPSCAYLSCGDTILCIGRSGIGYVSRSQAHSVNIDMDFFSDFVITFELVTWLAIVREKDQSAEEQICEARCDLKLAHAITSIYL